MLSSCANRRSLLVAILIAIGNLAAGPGVRGELIYFPGGFSIQAPARMEGDRVIVSIPGRDIPFPRSYVVKLVPGYRIGDDWKARLAQAGTDFKKRYAAVWWGLENGLSLEAIPELRELSKRNPADQPTARMRRVLDWLDQPMTNPDPARFQQALGVDVQVSQGPHVLLLHQHSPAEAAERIELLERVITAYYLTFAGLGIELRVPRERLVSAWFADQEDYCAFLKREDAAGFLGTRGYYHPTWRAVVAFDARSTAEMKGWRASLAERREELDRLRAQVSGAPARARIRLQIGSAPAKLMTRSDLSRAIEQLAAEADLRDTLLELDRRAIDLGTAAHEMIHQLAVSSGLAPRHDAFPRWLHEGLAAQFEVIRGGRWAGVSRAHDLRLPDWRRAALPELEPLLRDGGFAHGYNGPRYAHAWALVYYLRTQKPDAFLSLIDLLRAPPAEATATNPADRTVAAFHLACGNDLKSFTRNWINCLDQTRTPLEANAPPDAINKTASRVQKR